MKRSPNTIRGPRSFVRPVVQQLHAYVPGEQPKVRGLIKLNTNENPYPPSPKVLSAIRAAVDGRLRLYPNPTAQALREKLAKFHACKPENIIIGNGSDELLAMAVRAFVEPSIGNLGEATARRPRSNARAGGAKSIVQYFTPSYSLYPVLAEMHGANPNAVPLASDFSFPNLKRLETVWKFDAALTFVTTPNAPSGRGYSIEELETLVRAQQGVIVLDEAYVDFAGENAFALALRYPHVIVSRTFSKAYSLCFQRIGYFAAHPELIAALDKIRDSYNVNGLGQIAALATLDDLSYYRRNFRKIIGARESLIAQLTNVGFFILPSQTNFILARPPGLAAKAWLERLRKRKILVRWFNHPGISEFLRITIGTDREMAALLSGIESILAEL
jgi:histidinol-phosphate aminotransferase